MKKLFAALFTITVVCTFVTPGHAQLKVSPSGGNKRASVYEQVGLTDITSFTIARTLINARARSGAGWYRLVMSTRASAPQKPRRGARALTKVPASNSLPM
jgi:hypothetical protein